jgi:hypothetical protein
MVKIDTYHLKLEGVDKAAWNKFYRDILGTRMGDQSLMLGPGRMAFTGSAADYSRLCEILFHEFGAADLEQKARESPPGYGRFRFELPAEKGMWERLYNQLHRASKGANGPSFDYVSMNTIRGTKREIILHGTEQDYIKLYDILFKNGINLNEIKVEYPGWFCKMEQEPSEKPIDPFDGVAIITLSLNVTEIKRAKERKGGEEPETFEGDINLIKGDDYTSKLLKGFRGLDGRKTYRASGTIKAGEITKSIPVLIGRPKTLGNYLADKISGKTRRKRRK